MADINIAKNILETYDEITIEESRSNDNAIMFWLFDKLFALICPLRDDSTSKAIICVIDDKDFDYPHIMLDELEFDGSEFLPKGKYRSICLHEAGSLVSSLQTYEEKIIDEIDRLIELMQMSKLAVEREYQKEFLFYWDSNAISSSVDLFIGDTKECVKLDVYHSNGTFRYISSDLCLSDIDERDKKDRVWQHRVDINAFYIPIIDSRGIIPPTVKNTWGLSEIVEILYGKRISHISSETFQRIKDITIGFNTIDLVFSMDVNSLPITFMARIVCGNSSRKSLLQKIMEDGVSVQPIRTRRKDYNYLNRIIGNTTNKKTKKVLLVGAGSLGSYTASELVKNGYNHITIYDKDRIFPENFMRWAYGGILEGINKSYALKFYLEKMHPEIKIIAYDENIDSTKLITQMNDYDYIIFTVGSSDLQLKLNRVLKDNHCTAKTIFGWLEAGGIYSHLLYVDYQKQGCFECLYTASSGELINNKANASNEESVENNTIRNGCGGTRAAYGTAVLLRTVSALIMLMKKAENLEFDNNCLINIAPEKVDYLADSFIEKECRCCGDKS